MVFDDRLDILNPLSELLLEVVGRLRRQILAEVVRMRPVTVLIDVLVPSLVHQSEEALQFVLGSLIELFQMDHGQLFEDTV